MPNATSGIELADLSAYIKNPRHATPLKPACKMQDRKPHSRGSGGRLKFPYISYKNPYINNIHAKNKTYKP